MPALPCHHMSSSMELQNWKLWLWCEIWDTFELTSMDTSVLSTLITLQWNLFWRLSTLLANWLVGEKWRQSLILKWSTVQDTRMLMPMHCLDHQSVSLSWRTMMKPFILWRWELLFLTWVTVRVCREEWGAGETPDFLERGILPPEENIAPWEMSVYVCGSGKSAISSW